MRNLRWAGLVFSLLIVGVMGGLMAPLTSEAAARPSVTIKVCSGGATSCGTEVELIWQDPVTTLNGAAASPGSGSFACSQSEYSNYNLCYRLRTRTDMTQSGSTPLTVTGGSPSRTYSIKTETGSTDLASLLVNDKDGSNVSKLTHLRIEPQNWPVSWGCLLKPTNCNDVNETKIIIITSRVTFDYIPDASLTVQGSLSTSGNFFPTQGFDVINDTIQLDANGTFNATDVAPGRSMTSSKNYSRVDATGTKPLSGIMTFQFGGPANGSAYYQLYQTPANYDNNSTTADTYPLYLNCTNGSKCAYTKVEKYTVTLKGPDAFELQSSNDYIDVNCSITNNKGGQDPQGPPCFSNSKKNNGDATTQITSAQGTTITGNTTGAHGSPLGTACELTGNCQCTDPYTCKGKIVIAANVNPNEAIGVPVNQSGFFFSAEGPDIALHSNPLYFYISTNSAGTGTREFPDLFVGDTTAPWSFNAEVTSTLWPQPDTTHKYDPDGLACESKLNEYVYNLDGSVNKDLSTIVSEWTVSQASLKTNATVTKLGVGDTVTCTFTIHKKGINS